MGTLGTNVATGGSIPVSLITQLGFTTVRIVAKRDADDSAYFRQLADAGVAVWLVLARESFEGFGPNRSDGQPAPETIATGMAEYARRYADLIHTVEAGNEPDHPGASSWTLSPADFERLLWRARDKFGGNQHIVAGGLASGDPTWLAGVEATDPPGLDWVDGIAIHPYGRTPDARFPEVPAKYFGRVTALIAEYRDWLDTAGRTDKELHVSEWGAPITDFVTSNGVTDLEQQATYITNMARSLCDSELVGAAIHFCASDSMVAGFGLTDNNLQLLGGGLALRSLEGQPVNI
jgi:hypothetical protein